MNTSHSKKAANCGWSRREWVAAAIAVAGGMAGCGGEREGGAGRRLMVFNWSDYIEEGVLAQFEQEQGCRVVYDNYASDAEVETRLATGAGSGYDVVFPSDRAAAALLAKGLFRPLDRGQLPNFRHLDAAFLGLPFDPQNEFSAPYFWGTLAVGVRSDKIAEVGPGLAPLLAAANRGRITMLDDMENVVAAALSHLGHPLNSVAPKHLAAVERLLLEQRPLVQAYTSDSYRERLITGEAWAALGWSGDLLQADAELQAGRESGMVGDHAITRRESGRVGDHATTRVGDHATTREHGDHATTRERATAARVEVVIPPSGTMLWVDSMLIPRGSQNVELAHAFINFLLSPDVAVRNAVKVNYATPNAAARERLPAAMLADARIYPPAETLARCAWLEDRGKEIERIEQVWRRVRQ